MPRFTLFHIFTLLVLPSSSVSLLFHSCCSHEWVFIKTLVNDFISYCHTEWCLIFRRGGIVFWPKLRITKANHTNIDFWLWMCTVFWNIDSCQSSSFFWIMGGFLKCILWRISSLLLATCNRSFTLTKSNLKNSKSKILIQHNMHLICGNYPGGGGGTIVPIYCKLFVKPPLA